MLNWNCHFCVWQFTQFFFLCFCCTIDASFSGINPICDKSNFREVHASGSCNKNNAIRDPLAVQFSSKETLDLDIKEIKVLYSNPGYIVYLILMIGLLFLLHFVYRYYKRRKSEGKELNHTDIIMPLTYSISSALFGTQSTVQAKILAELLAVQSI